MNQQVLDQNEIRDYIARAPNKWCFNGRVMVNNSRVRLIWLSDIARGTLHEKINRRAGIKDEWHPWKMSPAVAAMQRHQRRQLVIKFGRRGPNQHSL